MFHFMSFPMPKSAETASRSRAAAKRPLPARRPGMDGETDTFGNSLKKLALATERLKKPGPSSDTDLFGPPVALSRAPAESESESGPASKKNLQEQPNRNRKARSEAEGSRVSQWAAGRKADGGTPEEGKKETEMAARGMAIATVPAAGAAPLPISAPVKSAKPQKETAIERRDRVVMENLALVKIIAVRVHESLPVHVELDDLVHAGILGLFDAATKFDADKQVAFSSYAKHRIKGAILDSLRQLDWASRDMRRRHKQVEQVTRDLYTTLQRNPTDDEVAEKMGVEVERWRQMAIDLRNVGLISASTRPNDQEELPAPDFPTTTDSHPDSMCAREQMREKLHEAMSVLPERYRKVVTLYYSNEMTMKEIGGLLGINESRVSQIHKSALEKMANALQSNGIHSAAAF
jgi:RNA polymerase sigma factor for flagellar operon FliA